jgi:hypothetical protein
VEGGVSGEQALAHASNDEQARRSRVLLIDERGCGASTDQVLASSSLSSTGGSVLRTSLALANGA